MARTSTLPKRLQPMLATLTDAPFDDKGWIFEDKYDGFRMVAKIEDGSVILYSRNGQITFSADAERASPRGETPLAFDLMFYDGEDLRDLTLLERKKRLNKSCRAISSSRSAVIARQAAQCFSRKRCAKALKASWPSALTANIFRAPARITG
jgi:ATP-dependent DNA ligase